MHFVDQVDLEAPSARCVLNVIEQFAGIFNFGAASGVHLDQIDEAPFIDFSTHGTLPAGCGTYAGFAIQALGKNARDGGLTHPPRASEQVGVMQALAVQGIDQSLEHMGLADHFPE